MRNGRVAQQSRNPRQRLEVIGTRAFRRQQQKNQIDRLAAERLEIDRAIETCEQSDRAPQAASRTCFRPCPSSSNDAPWRCWVSASPPAFRIC